MQKKNKSKRSNPLVHAIRLLTFRPRSKEELKKLLLDRDYSLNEVEQVIIRLLELEYLDDVKFMESWCNYRQDISPRSRRYVKRELFMKGISADDLEEHFDNFYTEENELNSLKNIIEKKLVKVNMMEMASDQKGFRKIYSALLRKGFNHSSIMEMLNRLGVKNLDIYE